MIDSRQKEGLNLVLQVVAISIVTLLIIAIISKLKYVITAIATFLIIKKMIKYTKNYNKN